MRCANMSQSTLCPPARPELLYLSAMEALQLSHQDNHLSSLPPPLNLPSVYPTMTHPIRLLKSVLLFTSIAFELREEFANRQIQLYGIIRVYKNHLKMVQGCRIDTGSCKKPLSKKDSPKTLGTRLSCKTGTGLGGQRARQA